jgi:hypothetical protein
LFVPRIPCGACGLVFRVCNRQMAGDAVTAMGWI